MSYRYLREQNLSEMNFELCGSEFCARIMLAALSEGEPMDISGMY